MTDEEFFKGKRLTTGAWTDAVRMIAPSHGVDADELLRKAPSFPVDAREPGQLQAFMAEVKLKADADELTVAELTVCMQASQVVATLLWQAIMDRYPDLPEFKDP